MPATLDGQEKALLLYEMPKLVKCYGVERDIMLDILMKNEDFVIETAEVAKGKFEAKFGGINASGNKFGWTLIRPEHLLRLTTDTGTTNTEWAKTVTAGWGDWIGTAAAPHKIRKYATMGVLSLIDYNPVPKAYATQFKVDNFTYPVWYFEPNMKVGNLHVWDLPIPIGMSPESTVYTQLKYSAAGTDEMAIFGVLFGTADYLQTQTPTLESP